MQKNYETEYKSFPEQKIPNHILNAHPFKKHILLPIYMRRFRETNWFMSTAGYPGTGKSFALLKMFSDLQVDPKTLEPNFDPEEQVVFTGMDFIKQVRKTDPIKNPGRCILFDEIEIEANSKGWDKVGQQIALAVNTMRFKQNILGASLPRETDLIKGVRSLRNSRLLTEDINFRTKQVIGKYQYVNYNLSIDTHDHLNRNPAYAYFPKMDYVDNEGNNSKIKIKQVNIGLPPKDIIKTYKRKKVDYLNNFYDSQLDFFKKEERKKQGGVGFDETYDYIKKNEDLLGYKQMGKVNPTLLANDLNISEQKATKFAKAYEVKKKIQQTKGNIYDKL